MKHRRIAFIGCGNMGRSLIGGLIANGYPADRLCGADINPDQREFTARQFGIEVLEDGRHAVKGVEVVVLAVKPQVMRPTIIALRPALAADGLLLISVAAGIRLSALARWAGEQTAIVRVMPNTPALIRTGAAVLCANGNVSASQRNTAESIMRSVGLALWVEDESLLDAVTALSGSGPAYFFYVMEVLENSAVALGLSREQARLLTLQTAFGAAKMALESQLDPAALRRQVTSPGGTTEQALNVLGEGRLDELFGAALKAARDRSVEIAGTLGDDS